MPAAEYNITISQGADFSRTFQLKESNVVKDITGYSFAGKIKKNFNETDSVSFTIPDPTGSDATNGNWTVSLTDTQTTALSPGDQVYDIVMEDGSGTKTRLLQGKAYISQGVS